MKYIAAMIPLALDLFFKNKIEQQPDTAFPRRIFHELITLEKHHNYGFCLNRAEKYPEMVTSVTCGLYAGFAVALAGTKRLSHSLIFFGALSNLIDRLIHGYVVDYFRLPFQAIHHLIMNLGDLSIFLGCLLMLIEEE